MANFPESPRRTKDFNWVCPHCEHAVTITDERRSSDTHVIDIKNAVGRVAFASLYLVCPNPKCNRFTLTASLYECALVRNEHNALVEKKGKTLGEWKLIPDTRAKTFPDYIPAVILTDYREACLIRDLSPKASATPSRRCLQGIIRDFWSVKVKSDRLFDEINAIKDKVDPVTWEAIDAVRKLGNVGAHMESDTNIIIDVDPDEAEMLIGLIETLLREWYVHREERKRLMGALVAGELLRESRFYR